MGALGSIAIGAALTFVFMVATAVVGFTRAARQPEHAAGMELLVQGATEWQPLASPDGAPVKHLWRGQNGKLLVSTGTSPQGSWWNQGRWEKTTELFPPAPTHPTVADTMWRALPDGGWLTATAGKSAPVLEPEKRVLPELPRVEKEKFEFRLMTATRLSDGSLLAAVQHVDGEARAWRLAPGATAWTDTGVVPAVAAACTLVAGFRGDALLVGGDGSMTRYDGARWTDLPRTTGERIGWEAALTEDGAVLAAGGFADTQRSDRAHGWVMFLALLVVAIVVARVLKVGVIAMAAGGCLGVVLAVIAFFALWILLGVRF